MRRVTERQLAHTKYYVQKLGNELSEWEWGGILERLIEEPKRLEERERAIVAEVAAADFHFFCTMILARDRLSLPGGFHGRVCRRLEVLRRPQFHLYYRGAFKSTIISIARPIWRVCQNPDHDHLMIVSDRALGVSHLSAIGRQIETNERLQLLFPHMKKGKKDWGEESRTVEGRSPSKVGSTWELRTTGQAIAGRHIGSIGIDDLVNDANYRSRLRQDELYAYIDSIWPALNTEELTLAGTRYADYDCWGRVIRHLYPEMLDLYVQPVRGRGDLGLDGSVIWTDDGTYAHPLEWDDRRYDRERKKIKDPLFFSAQYLLDTSQSGDLGFKAEWIEYHQGLLPHLTVYIGADPASGQGSSRPAIGVVGIDSDHKYYVLHATSKFATEAEFIDHLFILNTTYKPLVTGLERFSQGGWGSWELLQRQMGEKKQYFVAEPMTGAAQEVRVHETMWPLYQWNRVRHVRDLKGSDFESQLMKYPRGQYTDEVDAVCRAMELAVKYGFQKAAKEVRRTSLGARPGAKVGYTAAEINNHDADLERLLAGVKDHADNW